MLACMSRSTPPPVDARRMDDHVPRHLARLAGYYSPELVKLVAACLALDPLMRPQSVFEIQKVLQAAPAAPPPAQARVPSAAEADAVDAHEARGGWRGLVDRLGAFRRD
jgi:hypothetical protein